METLDSVNIPGSPLVLMIEQDPSFHNLLLGLSPG